MLKVERMEAYRTFLVVGEGIEAQVKYYDRYDNSLNGKGARKAKEEIIAAVQNFLRSEAEALQAKKEAEQQQKRNEFVNSSTFKNIDLLSLYNANMLYEDHGYYGNNWVNFNQLLTGYEVIDDSRVVNAEKVEIKNTYIYSIEVRSSIASADKRIISISGMMTGNLNFITGLTLKEKLLTGFKSYGNIRKADDTELRMLQQLGMSKKTSFVLGSKIDINKEIETLERFSLEMERAAEATTEPTQPIEYTQEGQQIHYDWLSCKVFNIDNVAKKELATYESYVIVEEITVTKEMYNNFIKTFNMSDLNSTFKGGTNSTYEPTGEAETFNELTEEQQGSWILGAYNLVLKVNIEGESFSLLIDPQGYDYARYIGIIGNFSPTPEDDNTKQNELNLNEVNEIENVEVQNVEPLEIKLSDNTNQGESLATFETGTGSKGNGIEINFSEKPNEETRKLIKSVGYKWGGKNRPSIWWAINDAETLLMAQSICNVVENDNNSTEEIEPQENEMIFILEPVIQKEMDLQYFSTTPDISEVIDIFDTVDTQDETNNTITAEDRKHCENLENAFKSDLSILESTLNMIQAKIDNKEEYTFLSRYNNINTLTDQIKNLTNSFIYEVVGHFTKKYNVKIDSHALVKKYNHNITLDMLIAEVSEVMNGLTFNELAEQQTKEALKKAIYNSDLKGNKVTLPSFLFIDSFDIKWGTVRVSYSCEDKITNLIKAIALYNNVTVESLEEFRKVIRNGQNEELIKDHYIGLNKIKSVKVFKNGRLDITFSNSATAQKFYNEYVN